jgi:DNA-binding XRE family transcriptional regulator
MMMPDEGYEQRLKAMLDREVELAEQRRSLRAEWEKQFLSGFGRVVKARREWRQMTQEELARRVGLTRSSIANIEAGRQDMPITGAAMLAFAFGVTLPQLLEGE